jgi:hypothetical protein
MPSVVTDPSMIAQSGIINNGAGPSASVWMYPDAPAESILNFQTITTQPLPAGTSSATGLVSPPLMITGQMPNFSPEVYDLAPSTTLIHFMQALLGDPGVGQLLKRQLVSRLQEALTSTNFYDLDSFYGALFGDIRGPSGTLPVNPATGVTVNPYGDLASPDGWDEVQAIDAEFRERIIALAKAITLGATVPGMRALGEAVSGYQCHVYEVWRIIDNQGPQPGLITLSGQTFNTTMTGLVTWYQMQAEWPLWNSIPAGTTWSWLMGYLTIANPQQYLTSAAPAFGGFGINCRSEVILVPRKFYAATVAGQQQMSADVYGISRVTEVLKPASVLLSVSTQSQLVAVPVAPAALWSPSNYWEVVYKVTPSNMQDPAYAPALAAYQAGGAPATAPYPMPSPPFCRSQGARISHSSSVTASWAQASQPGSPAGTLVDQLDSEIEVITGNTVTFSAPKAIMDPVRAASARTSSAVGVQAAPYAGPRQPAILHS